MNLDNASSAIHVFELSLWAIAWCYFLPRTTAKWLFLGAWGLCLVLFLVTLVDRVTNLAIALQEDSFFFSAALSIALGATMGFSSRARRDAADAVGTMNTTEVRDEHARNDCF